jgi:hypothetical protein
MLVGALADRTVVNLDASDLEDARTLLDRLDTTNPSAGVGQAGASPTTQPKQSPTAGHKDAVPGGES